MSQAFSNNHNSFNTLNTTTFNCATLDEISEILAWLSLLEPRAQHRDIGARRVESVGAWLLETEEFRLQHNSKREDAS